MFRDLLERSGVLREPTAGRVDFVHRTFQEYLAAKAAVDNDEIGLLIRNAHDDQWREVVVMAAGHAAPDQCAELLHGMLKRGRRRSYATRVGPLIVACMQTARRLDPRLRADIEQLAQRLVPPATIQAADELAPAGEMLLDLLRAKPPRTPGEAAASIRAASRIGGRSALRLISDILASHREPPIAKVEGEVINAWRYFKPDLYVEEVLARSWPPERELRVPDPGFIQVLHAFPQLRAVHCTLRDGRTGVANLDLAPLARTHGLQSVVLDGCRDDLDLGPLLNLPHLNHLELISPRQPPVLAPLSAVAREWTLTLSSPAYRDRLSTLGMHENLIRLILYGGDDITDFTAMPRRPVLLRDLGIYGFPLLASLEGIARWESLKTIELFECPQLSDLTPLASISSLEHISLGIFSAVPIDLSPLTSLPRLRTISLKGHNVFDLSPLSGIRDVVITVPAGAKVSGEDKLGPASHVTRAIYAEPIAEP